jgi:hypothetical protein
MERTWKPTTAGILTIISGCYGIGAGAAVTFLGGFANLPIGIPALGAIGGGLIGLGVVALIGGIFALKRRVWGMALAGAIVSLPLLPVGTVLGILSIIFVSKGKNEFS